MSVLIKNLRSEKLSNSETDVRVDRKSILGNPFYMKSEQYRDEVCDKYKAHFDKQMRQNTSFKQEVTRLICVYEKHKTLNLFCWCAPKRCHAETIREYILTHTKLD